MKLTHANIYIYIYIIYPIPLHKQDAKQGQIVKQNLAGSNSEFSFS